MPAKTEVKQIEIKEQRENEAGNCERRTGRRKYTARGMERGEGVGDGEREKGAGEIEQCSKQ